MNLTTLTDNELMATLQGGKVAALGELFQRYKPVLWTYYFRLSKDQPLSEDLVQNVFERILKFKDKFRGDGPFKYWMFHIARNVYTDHFRQNKITVSYDDIPVIADDARMDNNLTAETTPETLLHKALDRLRPEDKELLVLTKLEGMKYREVGAVLGVPENTVKIKVFRALRSLKNEYMYLDQYYQ